MVHKPKTKAKKAKATPPKIEDLDLDPDAWPKFERLLKEAAKKKPGTKRNN